MANRRASLKKKPGEVSRMFDEVASRYDLMNDVASLGQVRVWRAAVAAAVAAGPVDRVLDLAAGTATSTASYTENGASAVACDFSLGMLSEARRRRPEIPCVAGDAMRLPFADGVFDVVTMSYGLRNVNDPRKALKEMLRVAKPGGRLAIAEFSTPVWGPMRRLYSFYLGSVVPALSEAFSSDESAYDYLGESILAWPDQADLARMIQDAGWRSVAYRNLTGGIVAIHRAVRPMLARAPEV